MTATDLQAKTDDELDQLRVDVLNEQERRQHLVTIPDTIANLNRVYLDADGVEIGQEWRQAGGAYDAYPEGWLVTHDGNSWVSLTPANVWEPGVSSWREVVVDGAAPADWVQPTGATDTYSIGARVTYGGQVWISTAAANVWEPGVFGWTVDTSGA